MKQRQWWSKQPATATHPEWAGWSPRPHTQILYRLFRYYIKHTHYHVKVNVIPRQAEVAQGVPGRLRPRIFFTFGTTRLVVRQPYAPAAFTPGEIPGTHFQRLSRPQGTLFRRAEPREKSLVTPPGIDPGTVRLVAQCLNHYATPGPPTPPLSCNKWNILSGTVSQ
jgi:hypothetical protein